MNCEKMAELMSDYVDGCLSGQDCSDLETHLTVCRNCREHLESIRAVVTSLKHLAGCRCPVDCWPDVRRRVLDRSHVKPAWHGLLLRPAVAVPAAVGAAVLALILAWPAHIEEPAAQDLLSPPEYARYIGAHSAVQSRQMLTDPDVTFIAAELEKAALVNREEK